MVWALAGAALAGAATARPSAAVMAAITDAGRIVCDIAIRFPSWVRGRCAVGDFGRIYLRPFRLIRRNAEVS